MKTRFFVVTSLLLVGVVLLAACGGASAPAATPTKAGPVGDAGKGAEKFVGTCSSCHGPDAKGLPNLGKDLTTSTFVKGLTDAEFVAFIMKGRPSSDPANTAGVDMPPRGGNPALTDKDLADIVAFVRTINK